MAKKSYTTSNGTFIKQRGYTITYNSVVRDKTLSLKAKGLYTLIQSYITLEDFTLSKSFLKTQCLEGEKHSKRLGLN